MLPAAILILLVLIALSIPVAAALGWLGLILGHFFTMMPVHRAIGDIFWQNSIEFLLVAIPMFVMLGEILLRSGIATRMYDAMAKWLSWLPGGLMHSNIGACALFAATSGSSVATAATIGTVAEPEMHKRKYNEPMFLGTIAAGGTLGILIPPSINLIVFGLLTNTSVSELYLAGFVPGLLLAGLFMATVIIACLYKPQWGGEKITYTWSEKIKSLVHLGPPILIFLVVVGSIYAGWATPTEAASLGVVAALILAAFHRSLSISMLKEVFKGTMRTTGIIMLIIVAAVFLNFVLSAIGLTTQLTDFIVGLGLGPLGTLLLIVAFYIILGCFMETFSMLITTATIVTPIVVSMGYDPVWFGILLMVLLETALITPPIGINLFVVQSIRSSGQLKDLMIGALPFVATMFAMIALLIAFPELALWLPQLFY
ncbi:TRAP transporter large permease subunit [Sneathiella sp. P13V-1]|uniref:TRAP transporter large permease n=1 Tax=Sneathiella sp. P13V-1 TaxID=2697366 RepID=UPI00187B97D8|nr:TRAP transporter large permease [Sneathiella sp. P13V-1]MBE7637201.1 TRAP transporter large permease subunit [Sneathiella sp. P13V-1]